jgi:hypothetical protein
MIDKKVVKLMGKKCGDRSVNIPGIGVGFMPRVSHLIIIEKILLSHNLWFILNNY